MKRSTLQNTIVLLALSIISSTVAPVIVFAEDSVSISNVARSSISTGGMDGQDGQSGEDGQDGRDGTSGQAGVSVTTNAAGDSTAIVEITSTNSGQGVIEYTSNVSEVVVDSASSATATPEISVPTQDQEESLNQISDLLRQLQLIITTYVSYLF